MNCFGRADINTGLAVNAHILVNLCLALFHGDCRCRALTHTGFASGTLFWINDCYQLVHSVLYVSATTKKAFLLQHTGRTKTRVPSPVSYDKGVQEKPAIPAALREKRLSGKKGAGLFPEPEHIVHVIDAGLLFDNPLCCTECTACKDRTVVGPVGELDGLEIL